MNTKTSIAPASTNARRAWRPANFASAHDLGRSTVYAMIKAGKIKTIKIGSATLIPAEESDRLMREGA